MWHILVILLYNMMISKLKLSWRKLYSMLYMLPHVISMQKATSWQNYIKVSEKQKGKYFKLEIAHETRHKPGLKVLNKCQGKNKSFTKLLRVALQGSIFQLNFIFWVFWPPLQGSTVTLYCLSWLESDCNVFHSHALSCVSCVSVMLPCTEPLEMFKTKPTWCR